MEATATKTKNDTCERCGSPEVHPAIVGAALIDEKMVMECQPCGHREGIEAYMARMSATLNL